MMRVRLAGLCRSLTAVSALALVLAVLTGPSLRAAEPLAKPTGPVIVTVTGAIDRTNSPKGAQFDLQMLQALGVDHLATSTTWTNGKPTFEGVLVRKLLDAVGAHGKTISPTAKDDYAVDIPIDDFTRYPVLLAWGMNGQLLGRERAPTWIIYPKDDYPELVDAKMDMRWVWQVVAINVK